MAEAIDWLADGTPYSPRFGDRYRSNANDGLDQAQETFLGGCGLPAAWQHQAQWRILETGFGLGLNFLVTWAAWRNDPARPRLLHFVSCEAWPVQAQDILRAVPHSRDSAPLQVLAQQLAAQFWGILPGVHRLSFEGGRVLLTLYVGDAQTLLRQQKPTVDSVYLDGFSPQCNPQMWSYELMQAVTRCCRLGTRLATWSVARPVREALTQCGFVVQKVPGTPPKRDNLQATYQPHWVNASSHYAGLRLEKATGITPSHCIVLGAGLAGAALAASLARRGWQVCLVDKASTHSTGASGLPAGLLVPHTSRDDAPLSRLTRAGVRLTRQWAHDLLTLGQDWAPSGVLEHCVDGAVALAPDLPDFPEAAHDWSYPASAEQCAALHLPPHSRAVWHASGGWVRPARLVAALLAQPESAQRITWQGDTEITRIERRDCDWVLLDASDTPCAQAPWDFLATGADSVSLCAPYFAPQSLRPLRGQVLWAMLDDDTPALAPSPVNGYGNFIPDAARMWVLGSTFERGQSDLPKTAHALQQGQQEIAQRLHTLLPEVAQQLGPYLQYLDTDASMKMDSGASPTVQSWCGVRCAAPDRRPVVGAIDPEALPGLWISTALGARGLVHALLCAELIAAQLHAEPLPLEAKLAQWLRAQRLRPS